MTFTTTKRNRTLLDRYFDQPSELPADIRTASESALGGPIQLYAAADLNEANVFALSWLILGEESCAVAYKRADGTLDLRTFRRDAVRKVRETPGLSCTQLAIDGDPGDPSLAVLRYTHRQRQAVGTIAFILTQQTEGRLIEPASSSPDELYASSMVEPVRNAQSSASDDDRTVFWRLIGFLKPYKWRVATGFGVGILLTAISLLPPYLTRFLIDDVLFPVSSMLEDKGEIDISAPEIVDARKMAYAILFGVVAVYLVRNVLLWLRLKIMTMVGEHVARDLRDALYRHLQTLSVRYFSDRQTGSIISRVSSDTDRIWDFVAFGITELTLSALMLTGLGVMLVTLDWRLGLIMVLPVPLIIVFINWMGVRMHRIFLRMWQKWSAMTAVLSDTIPGIRVVKAFNQSDSETERFRKRNAEVTDEAGEVIRVWSTFWPIIFFGIELMVIFVWVFAIPRIFGDGATLTTGTFVAFLLYAGMFIGPMETFGYLTRMVNRSLSSAYRVFEVLDTEPDVRDVADGKRLEPLEGRITFEEVTFGYDPVRQILKGISFEIQPGEMIGLVGPSGAGKTTVTNLIARFYDVTSGRILIDGVDIRDLDSGHYRQQIGMVLQDPYLFHGSVIENIRYGMPEATPADVIAAARAANAHDFICKLPHGYDTIVGERGHTLSGGERQRVSIARAVLHNPQVLILDEATSSVDTETERKIQEAIDRLIAGRTTIAIAHRLSTLQRADRLFVMKDGRIVESGKHQDLLEIEDGVYKKLHNIQRELHEMYAV